MAEKAHVLVTHYIRDEGGLVVHAYGAFTPSQASSRRKAMLAEHALLVRLGQFEAHACKVIDIDAMNAKEEWR
jgi:hypothetical protein